jgi:hypothetical protein
MHDVHIDTRSLAHPTFHDVHAHTPALHSLTHSLAAHCTHAKALYIAYELSPTLDDSPATSLAVETTWKSVSRMRAYGSNGVFAAQVRMHRSIVTARAKTRMQCICGRVALIVPFALHAMHMWACCLDRAIRTAQLAQFYLLNVSIMQPCSCCTA